MPCCLSILKATCRRHGGLAGKTYASAARVQPALTGIRGPVALTLARAFGFCGSFPAKTRAALCCQRVRQDSMGRLQASCERNTRVIGVATCMSHVHEEPEQHMVKDGVSECQIKRRPECHVHGGLCKDVEPFGSMVSKRAPALALSKT